jgi:mRNA-degrading endonuclease RelE of RelBE toxin-antitoxin system
MLIVQTPIFTKRVLDILTDDEYRGLQLYLTKRPDAGDLLSGTRGLRKLRWSASGRGKRGGARVVYYWIKSNETLLMLFIFKKNERSDLTKDQLKLLQTLAGRELR